MQLKKEARSPAAGSGASASRGIRQISAIAEAGSLLRRIKNMVFKKQMNAIILFFAVMAGLTVLSRIADSFMIPQTAVTTLEEMELKYPVEIEGRVGTEREQAVCFRENLRIGNVYVQKNDLVEKGDLLFSIDMEDLTSKMEQMEQEIRKYDLQIADIENAYQEQVNLQNQNINRAKEDYNTALRMTEKEVHTAYIEMENIKNKLEQHDSLKPESEGLVNQKADEKGIVRQKECLEAKEWSEGDYGETEETAISDRKSALEKWSQKRGELEQEYDEKRKSYENAVTSRDESLKEAARKIEDAGRGENKNNSAALQQIEAQDYAAPLSADGYRPILKYGIAMYKKGCMVKKAE